MAPNSSPSPDGPAIEVRAVSKLFARTDARADTLKEGVLGSLMRRNTRDLLLALDDVSLTVGRGEVFGLIGANGSGKSTLLKLIAGISQPTRGRIVTRGRVLGLIELGAGFHPDLSGEENIRLQGSIYGLTAGEVQQRIEPILDFAELRDFRHMPVRHYSSGMFVRLGFAIAMHCEPEILLVDEVLSVGDQAFQERCLRTIRQRCSQGMTIIFVTHYLEQAERLCDRIAWLDQGRLRQVGPTHELVAAWHRDLLETRYQAPSGPFEESVWRAGVPGRFGSGEARVERLCILDAQEHVRTSFRPGETMRIAIEYSAAAHVTGVDCTMPIVTIDNTLIAHTRLESQGPPSRPVDGRGRIELTLENLPLLAGRYELSLALSAPGDPWRHYDVLYKLFFFSIQPREDWDTLAPLELTPQVELRPA